MTSIRVLVVDDEPIVRDGLSMILATYAGIEVVGTAADGADALQRCALGDVDVVLLDIRMPGIDGLEVLRRLAAGTTPAPHVVVLTTFDLDDYVRAALSLGACGFLLKNSPHERIAAAVRSAAEGETVLSASVLSTVVEGYLAPAARPAPEAPADLHRLEALTARELEILRLVGEGCSNAAIASELFLSLHTVKTHVSRILQKTECENRGQAAALAHRCQSYLASTSDG
ncbi:DNA-binding response regulator [Nocardioides silvaticus]|uniref:DNA-binding response regulator n=1 Tax=Nocardioides silvaticus TaxID=2201891 RepID=A0A316TCD3_9ACTN|nr:response regulator transcription factor [Nocardioides silvaticus]PWN02080.1 DNA-binding response regulator [Nocardioides silvaticus]